MKNCQTCETEECDQRGIHQVIPDWNCSYTYDSTATTRKKPLSSAPQRSSLRLVTIHLPEKYLEGIEQLVDSKLYPNRSELVRIAVRDLLKDELWRTDRE